ncbi:hypothetical protein IWW50_003087 [Coemansia erecta]|nr:hypothetical protein IWW50_003087 [Coemansia erecta]
MQTALHYSGYSQHAAMLSSAHIGRAALQPRDEDSDNIDDILRNLWPTTNAADSYHGLPLLPSVSTSRSRTPMLSSGASTPPETDTPYTLAAVTANPVQNAAAPPPLAAPLTRSVSETIQIGDPEWRVDSPQSIHTSPALSTKLPSPVSPSAPMPLDSARSQPKQARQPTSLGLGPGSRALPQLRRATLGLLRNSSTGPKLNGCRPTARALTPEERVARLHSVSGLAARAVARRCLSGQIPPLDADAMLRQSAGCVPQLPSGPALKKKPTFADVARGSQDH